MGGILSCDRRRPTPETAPDESSEKTSREAKVAEAKRKAMQAKELGNQHFKEKDFENALELYALSAELHRDDPSVWLNLSIVKRQLGDFKSAEEDAEIAVRLDGSNPKAHYSKAMALRQMGNSQDALDACLRGLQKVHDDKAKALQQLKCELEKEIPPPKTLVELLEEDAATGKQQVPKKQLDEDEVLIEELPREPAKKP
eukprot:TRINITY_DN103325_c0_g1_i1.p1 TRINITY_DN103325_c0_g1~~TRINITY_DN103325_c0_g1_i1.p1  ORF type:complete len:200 (-),score=66.94 TRINITY_DN103325_c0_g1_i1:464-1063(-)